jgi:hypothetical protein
VIVFGERLFSDYVTEADIELNVVHGVLDLHRSNNVKRQINPIEGQIGRADSVKSLSLTI